VTSALLLPDLLLRSARLYPGRPAVQYEDRQLSYAELWGRANRLARALRHHAGLARGSRFAVLAMNTIEFPEILFAAAISGTVCVPINYRLSAREISEMLADSEASALITDERLADLVSSVVDIGFDGSVVWLGQDYEELVARGSAVGGRMRTPGASDIVVQIYTSGTTGSPKGALLSHRNIVANSWGAVAERNIIHEDAYLLASPLCHLSAAARIFSAALVGASVVIMPRFDPERMASLIAEGAVTTTVVAPAMIPPLLEAAAGLDQKAFARFRRLTYGSSPMPRPVLLEAMERLGCEFQQGYGLTEASPNLTVLSPADHVEALRRHLDRLGSVGRETTGVAVRVIDENDREVASGEPGEVVARGPNVMEGYWRRPEATAQALRGGWLHTGDIGIMDEDRYLRLVDRKTDMLISGGLNVYPREIELQLEAHPSVLEAAVVGRVDAKWGEVPVAFIVVRPLSPGDGPTAADLVQHCRARLARYKVPAEIRFVSALPRNAGGKVQKLALRSQLRDD
jgi:fatty-acyl-CoA synthase